MASIVALLTLCGGVYYVSRLAPRAMARAAAASAPATALPAHLRYKAYEHSFLQAMTDREALLILGFEESQTSALQRPSAAEIRDRYRHCMTHLHSDVEGSSYVAAKINEARDVLLRSQ